ncbi:Probable LRR receptor-like serine/threonine-protein kinase RKF3 [Linum perenne]
MSAVLLLIFLLGSSLTVLAQNNTTDPCPLNFSILRQLVATADLPSAVERPQACQYIRQALRLLQSDHLLRTNTFLPPLSSADSCWRSYQRFADDFIPNFDIRSSCGFRTSWISQGCINVTTRDEFESRVPRSALSSAVSNCNQSLENRAPCAGCVSSLSRIQGLYFTGPSIGNVSTCSDYPSIYAAAFVNFLGPTDIGTDKCLFLLDFTSNNRSRKSKALIPAVSAACGVGLLLIIVIGWFCLARRRKLNKRKEKEDELEIGLDAGLVKFDYEEIRKATDDFSIDNIVGKGGFGNVYRGEMIDGTEVAVKRFKNCSAAGDESFAHEVGVIGSIRHVNLVALKGYCKGHQRMIICELMNNGSLHDHLFGSNASKSKLSWPIRQKIALGTARGLAYLHTGAQPTIIHRDIKASNILLDNDFEPKVADFGLAKSNPEGMTHLSTRVAGTWGYLAPEYALYGQLTERSDVYSYGVVLLELLSGKKALMRNDGSQPYLLADVAWTLAKEGRAIELVEDGMPERGDDGNESRKLSWPVRQKIALGTAKGLAYLHYGAQPGIIHRDIKASNILLDDNFEAKVADFGLAKFNPEGMTHLSTRVAGTMGYVAPEYALYGQLTERSDVYSYGVVLLELLSGKKALFKLDDEDSATQPCLLTDWAWSLVKEGRGLDVVEDGMPELAAPDVLERYVLVAVLCSHPQLYARPTMDQVVKMLETELVVPSIPQRSIPLVSEMDDIERSVSSTSGSGQLFSPSGYHSFGFGPSGTKEEEDAAAPESRT